MCYIARTKEETREREDEEVGGREIKEKVGRREIKVEKEVGGREIKVGGRRAI